MENLNILDNQVYFDLLDLIVNNEIPKLLILINSILAKGIQGDILISGLGSFFRDLLVSKDSKSIALVLLKSILSNMIDERVNMINVDYIAKERNINFSHTYNSEDVPFYSLIKCIIKTDENNIELSGSVFDENHIRIFNTKIKH